MIANSAVVDTNLIFSALIPKASRIRDLFFDNSLHFYTPNFLISEIYKHKEKLINSSELNEEEFFSFFNALIERFHFVPVEFISLESRQKAFDLCQNIDPKDTPFIALSIELNIPFWTGDKKLKSQLKRKGFRQFFNE
jgi:predicted nucleic acid-binding protein